MKKSILLSVILFSGIIFFNSCGINSAILINQNQSQTQVQLSSQNFKVLERVSGSAEVKYILLFGGTKQKQLYAQAYAAMLAKAGLTGSKAIANIVTEEHIGGVPPFYYKRTITVSAHVIEFTK